MPKLLFPIITDDDQKTGFSFRFMHEIGLREELMLSPSHCTCTQEFKNKYNGEGYWEANTLANLYFTYCYYSHSEYEPTQRPCPCVWAFRGRAEAGRGVWEFCNIWNLARCSRQRARCAQESVYRVWEGGRPRTRPARRRTGGPCRRQTRTRSRFTSLHALA